MCGGTYDTEDRYILIFDMSSQKDKEIYFLLQILRRQTLILDGQNKRS